MKNGVKRINPKSLRLVFHAQQALDHLRLALLHCKAAGSCYTVERVRAAISSAKGAVRAASYRADRCGLK